MLRPGAVKFYKPPTPNATVYGVTYNQADGTMWFADMSGNNVTRFDPKTERFTEYPIPQRPDRSYARFIGADIKGRVWFTEYFGVESASSIQPVRARAHRLLPSGLPYSRDCSPAWRDLAPRNCE